MADGFAFVELAVRGRDVLEQHAFPYRRRQAAPILHPLERTPIGTICVAGPSLRLTDADLDRIAPLLCRAAHTIADRGAASPNFPQAKLGR